MGKSAVDPALLEKIAANESDGSDLSYLVRFASPIATAQTLPSLLRQSEDNIVLRRLSNRRLSAIYAIVSHPYEKTPRGSIKVSVNSTSKGISEIRLSHSLLDEFFEEQGGLFVASPSDFEQALASVYSDRNGIHFYDNVK